MEYLVAISFLIISLVTVYSLVKLNTRTWIVLLVIPYLIFTAGFSFNVYNSLKGFATTKPIPEGSRFVYGVNLKPEVFILVSNPDGLRLHVMPYDEFVRKEVEKANEMVEEGKQVDIKYDGTSDVPRMHQFDHKKVMPKKESN